MPDFLCELHPFKNTRDNDLIVVAIPVASCQKLIEAISAGRSAVNLDGWGMNPLDKFIEATTPRIESYWDDEERMMDQMIAEATQSDDII